MPDFFGFVYFQKSTQEEFFNTFNALIIDDHKFAIGKTHIMQSIEFI